MAKKSYYLKTKKGHMAHVIFEGTKKPDKKPDKKVIEALSKAVDLAYNKKIP